MKVRVSKIGSENSISLDQWNQLSNKTSRKEANYDEFVRLVNMHSWSKTEDQISKKLSENLIRALQKDIDALGSEVFSCTEHVLCTEYTKFFTYFSMLR